MRLVAVLVSCLLVILSAGCSPPSPSKYPYASEPDPRGRDYVIQVSDVLDVRVWGNDDLNTEPTVRPDGTITVPLVGETAAAGRTPTQVKKAIARALAAYLKDAPAVTVAVTRTSYRVAVSGKVERPGLFDAQRYLTVSEAIVLAGGPTRFASPNATVLIRREAGGKVRRIPIQYEELEAGRYLEQDVVLLNGDRVHVP